MPAIETEMTALAMAPGQGLTTHQLEECRHQHMHAFGTSEIFRARYRALGKKLQVMEFLGIAVPASVGATVATVGLAHPWMPVVLAGTGLLSIVQLVGSIWSVSSRWSDEYSYARESMNDNLRLSNVFKDLMARGSTVTAVEYTVVKTQGDAREAFDHQHTILPAEQRFGMRSALHQFRVRCVNCSEVPSVDRPSACSVCGK